MLERTSVHNRVISKPRSVSVGVLKHQGRCSTIGLFTNEEEYYVSSQNRVTAVSTTPSNVMIHSSHLSTNN
jgi:hypothetical protein